jgi:hypothetical protein
MCGARWCDRIGPRILGAIWGSPGVPTQSLFDAVPGDRPDTSVAANQIAPSCTAHPVLFSRLGQSICAVVHPCHFFLSAFSRRGGDGVAVNPAGGSGLRWVCWRWEPTPARCGGWIFSWAASMGTSTIPHARTFFVRVLHGAGARRRDHWILARSRTSAHEPLSERRDFREFSLRREHLSARLYRRCQAVPSTATLLRLRW